MVRVGLYLLFGSWLPLIVVGLLDPSSNPIGLGLLGLAGSLLGAILLPLGLLASLFRRRY